jgi:hypothetical protein
MMGYMRNVQQDIYVIPKNGGEPKQLTDDPFNNTNPLWALDGSEILYFAGFFPDEPREYPALRAINHKQHLTACHFPERVKFDLGMSGNILD